MPGEHAVQARSVVRLSALAFSPALHSGWSLQLVMVVVFPG